MLTCPETDHKQKKRNHTTMKRRIIKLIKWLPLLLFIYEIGGALLPFVHTKQVSSSFVQNFDPRSFFSDTEGPDRARIVESSMDALECRIQMIHQAKKRIVLSTFDIRDGSSCRDIFSSLLEAADRGVRVDILVDGLYGSLHMGGNPIFYAAGSHPNIEIRFYNVPSLFRPWTINGRLHDKYLLIDDKLLLMGGRNTFDYFLGEYNPNDLSYDRDVLVYNTAYGAEASKSKSVLSQIDAYFESVWNSPYCRTVFDSPSGFMKKKLPGAREELSEYDYILTKTMPGLVTADHDYGPETVPIRKATLISNPIHIMAKEPRVWYQITYLMEHAKNRVTIQTPYAVLSDAMDQGLTAIASSVPDTTLLVNATSVGDNIMASSDYTHNRGEILKTGVRLREYFGDRSSHGKSILIDDRLSIIGSYNLDMRSTYVDTETMLVIDGEELNSQLDYRIGALERDSLTVKPDGSYEEDPAVSAIPLTAEKRLLFAVTSRLFQLIRYLI